MNELHATLAVFFNIPLVQDESYCSGFLVKYSGTGLDASLKLNMP